MNDTYGMWGEHKPTDMPIPLRQQHDFVAGWLLGRASLYHNKDMWCVIQDIDHIIGSVEYEAFMNYLETREQILGEEAMLKVMQAICKCMERDVNEQNRKLESK